MKRRDFCSFEDGHGQLLGTQHPAGGQRVPAGVGTPLAHRAPRSPTEIPASGEGLGPRCSPGSAGAFRAAAEQNHRVVGWLFLFFFFSFYNFLCEIKLNKQALLGALQGREPAFLQMCVSSAITTTELSSARGWDICKISPRCLLRFRCSQWLALQPPLHEVITQTPIFHKSRENWLLPDLTASLSQPSGLKLRAFSRGTGLQSEGCRGCCGPKVGSGPTAAPWTPNQRGTATARDLQTPSNFAARHDSGATAAPLP